MIEQVGNDGARALAGARRREGEEMAGPIEPQKAPTNASKNEAAAAAQAMDIKIAARRKAGRAVEGVT